MVSLEPSKFEVEASSGRCRRLSSWQCNVALRVFDVGSGKGQDRPGPFVFLSF